MHLQTELPSFANSAMTYFNIRRMSFSVEVVSSRLVDDIILSIILGASYLIIFSSSGYSKNFKLTKHREHEHKQNF